MKLYKLLIATMLTAGHLYAGNPDPTGITIEICNTVTNDDDYICVTDGEATDPFVETTITLIPGGPKWHEVTLTTVDGKLKYEVTYTSEAGVKSTVSGETVTYEAQCGVAQKVKVWGLQTSTAADKTKIKANVDTGLSKEEDMTVFEGIELRFEGTYYSNVDVREFGRRPWDGRKDTKPNTKFRKDIKINAAYGDGGNSNPGTVGTVPGLDTLGPFQTGMIGLTNILGPPPAFGYQSAISFDSKMKDNPGIPKFKPWARPVSVKVVKVLAKDPKNFELKKDPLNDEKVRMTRGNFENIANDGTSFVPDTKDIVRKPRLEFGNLLIVENADKSKDKGIDLGRRPSLEFSMLPTGDAAMIIQNLKDDTSHKELAKILGTRASSWLGVPALYEHDDLTYIKGAGDSLAVECMLEEIKNGKMYNFNMVFRGIHEIDFVGNLTDGRVWR